MTDDRTGGDEDVFAADILFAASAQAHAEFVGRGEAGVSADQGEFAAFQLVGAVFGEFGDEAAFAFDDFRAVKTCVLGMESELVRFAHVLQTVGRFDECFARHASAEDAKAAEFLGSVDYGGAQTFTCRGAGRRVSRAATPDHDEIELIHHGLCKRGRTGWRTRVEGSPVCRARWPDGQSTAEAERERQATRQRWR